MLSTRSAPEVRGLLGNLFDLVIRAGRVVDGTGNPWFRSDVGISDGKIERIGDIANSGAREIKAQGLIVCPGFIDMHSHADFTLLAHPKAESMARQGVTTLVIGNCGDSAAPSLGQDVQRTQKICEDYGIKRGWGSFSDYLRALENAEIGVNVASLVGHSTIRRCVVGVGWREATSVELDEMRNLVRESMEAGAFGMSSGLVYAPGMYAKANELMELCRIIGECGGMYASHIRGERETLVEAVKEVIEIGAVSQVPVEISHHAPKIGAWGQSVETLRLIDEARARGVEVTCDMQPYVGGITPLVALLPPWVQEEGMEKTRIKDRAFRKKIRQDMIEEKIPGPSDCGLVKRGMWDKIMISSHSRKEFVGKTLQEIAQERGLDPFDAYFDLVLESDTLASVTGFYYNEEDVRRVLVHGCSMIGSDAAGNHPRWYGTFPMFFRKYVRGETRTDLREDAGEKILTCESMVRTMTSLPAQKLGLKDRGILREDMMADVVIFNIEKIADKATYLQPRQYPEGIEHVLVNGVLVVENGEHTGALPGRLMKHHL